MTNRWAYYLYGLIGGIGASAIINLATPPNVDSARILPQLKEEPVMILYKRGRDWTYIKSSTDSTEYIPLGDYLKTNFPDDSERKIEEARIELLVLQAERR